MLNKNRNGLFVFALVACCTMAACSEKEDDNGQGGGNSLVACENGSCADGFTCDNASNKCLKNAEEGESCDSKTFCLNNMICTKDRVCGAASEGSGIEGDSCSDKNDCALNLVCNEGHCAKSQSTQTIDGPGSSCFNDKDCASSLKCLSGVCTKVAGLKASCAKNPCEQPYVCEEESKICKIEMKAGGDCSDSTQVTCKSGTNCLDTVNGKFCVDNTDGLYKDKDGDTIADFYDTCEEDTDDDGLVDCEDLDSDGDTIPDSVEGGAKNVGDVPKKTVGLVYDFLVSDSDKNGILDGDEACPPGRDKVKDCGLEEMPVGLDKTDVYMAYTRPYDTDGDTLPDYRDEDNDGDLLDDLTEISGFLNGKDLSKCTASEAASCAYGTYWVDPSTKEITEKPGDAKHPVDSDNDTIPNYMTPDSDGDGLSDKIEWDYDSDGDGIYDGMTINSDGDEFNDIEETERDSNGYHPLYRSDGSVLKDSANNTLVFDDHSNCLMIHGNAPLATSDGSLLVLDSDGYIHAIHPVTGAVVEDGGLIVLYDRNGNVLMDGELQLFKDASNHLVARKDGELVCADAVSTPAPAKPECNAANAAANLTVCVEESGSAYLQTCVAEVTGEGDEAETKYVYQEVPDSVCESGKCNSDGDACKPVSTTCDAKIYDKTEPLRPYGFANAYKFTDDYNKTTYCFRSIDCDGDGLTDSQEVTCRAKDFPAYFSQDTSSMFTDDVDGDTFLDAEEYSAAMMSMGKLIVDPYGGDNSKIIISKPEDLMCAKGVTSKSVLDFAFTLKYKGESDSQKLTFMPSVSKLDLVFNLDVTGSMGKEVENLQKTLQSVVITNVRKSVTDSAFGISEFADFPVSTYGRPDDHIINGGQYFKADVPWILHTVPEQNPAKLSNAVNKYSLSDGGDYPEAGYDSLYLLAKADELTGSNKIQYTGSANSSFDKAQGVDLSAQNRWGGAGFRNGSLPVVVHITDALSHNSASDKYKYNTSYVTNARSAADVNTVYTQKGIRLMTIFRRNPNDVELVGGKWVLKAKDANGNRKDDGITSAPGAVLPELYDSSRDTKTYVDVCAFMTDKNETTGEEKWTCGAGKCCTELETTGNLKATDPDENGKCVLSYGITSGDKLTTTVVQGVNALVKYGTYSVSTKVRGDDVTLDGGSVVNTSCLIDKIEALEYIPPTKQPAKSCNPTATKSKIPVMVNGSMVTPDYDNGFINFAPGTSSAQEPGASLKFNVIGQNNCIPAKKEAQNFNLEIDVYDPTTGLVLGTQTVTVTVPAEGGGGMN